MSYPQPIRQPTDARPAPVATAIAWCLTVVTVTYFLPWAIAATRGKSNHLTVFVVNLLLGWTLIGWIVALVMACGAHQVTGPVYLAAVVTPVRPGGWPPAAPLPPHPLPPPQDTWTAYPQSGNPPSPQDAWPPPPSGDYRS